MIVHCNSTGAGRSEDGSTVVGLDVEWQKNYRVKDGNRAFCYSLVWVSVPRDRSAGLQGLSYRFKSVYLEPGEEPQLLATNLDTDLRDVLSGSDPVVGHQLCSDLAVVERNGLHLTRSVSVARDRWRERRTELADPAFIDTRFDIGHLLSGKSRRLVDVCEELGLDVEQPELRTKSMTALHRDWLDDRSVQAHEKIAVLNLRHSLSSALLALHSLGCLSWSDGESVNDLLYAGIRSTFDYADSGAFQSLLGRHGCS